MMLLLPKVVEVEVEPVLAPPAAVALAARAPEDLEGTREHMGAAHTEAAGSAARRESGKSMMTKA